MTQQEFAELTKTRRAIQELKDSRIMLRDFLAAAAIIGLASRNTEIHEGVIGYHAQAAYKYADAMLREREAKPSPEEES